MPERATMSESAVLHKTQQIYQQIPTQWMKHTLTGTIALFNSQNPANRPQKAKYIKGKSYKGWKQSDALYGTRYKP